MLEKCDKFTHLFLQQPQLERVVSNRHIISILVENEAGALTRIAGLFSARAYNIDCLSVAPTDDETLSRMTIVTSGSEDVISQIEKQLKKLIDVVAVEDLTNGPHIEREMMLIKVATGSVELRNEVKHLADIFRARILDVTEVSYSIEVTGASAKLDAFIDALRSKEILEVVRSGVLGIQRGDVATAEQTLQELSN